MSNDTAAVEQRAAETIWNIADLIELQAQRRPAATALITPDRILTYRELDVAVRAVARRLLDSGVQAGQKVGVSMMQTSLHLMTLLAIARIGAFLQARLS